ncbi:anthranilate synthase component I family protein [Chitinophaga horti]|uniref:Anthranilate synthase component I family protein n=1 Tax=Chitinophaga horti TaxID=2920382 RepID=A0ABY6J3W4_9BACT|nr:anthranilate synthase component I family protein [Chitinophaga horti]UYQ93322.1 anthranilate synthase component I family protein [Chitinophaga horti]
MDSNKYEFPYSEYEAILAAGAVANISCDAGNAFETLRDFHNEHQDWLFGHLSYDLKNETEALTSELPDFKSFPDLHFFVPDILLFARNGEVEIGGHNVNRKFANSIYEDLLALNPEKEGKKEKLPPLQLRVTENYYLDAVKAIQEHIAKGDCYELNFCIESYVQGITLKPLPLFNQLNEVSPAPFASYYKNEDQFLLCSSPERFLKKKGDQLISQPIKGTIKRLDDPEADAAAVKALENSPKERSENVMIVDLVRNDLAHTALQGTVKVEELCGVYSFPQVHHLISTVTATLDKQFHFTDAIRHAFPMGSMTGAPKVRVMELIEQYEKTKRGLYSGSVGYITPEGDFDFNVVIRSILYNADSLYLSFQTGSAITTYSDAKQEWEECLLKAAAMRKVLGYEE